MQQPAIVSYMHPALVMYQSAAAPQVTRLPTVDTASPDLDLGPVIEPYGCEGDMAATQPLMERLGLTFG